MTIPDLTLPILGLASLLAGFVDAVVGGGGLVLLPALLTALPQTPPATLFGTNKAAAVWGTAAAMRTYLRRVEVPWRVVRPAAMAAFAGALAGAATVSAIGPGPLRRLLPLLLAAVLVYTLIRKDLGRTHQPRSDDTRSLVLALLCGATIGFYDGFFGPGTGSILVFVFVRVFGYDFLRASASAKIVNVSTNLAAIALFAFGGHIMLELAIVMALCNIAGSIVGTRVALRHGSGFVRVMFILVVSLLIAKTAWDAFLR